MEHHPNHRVGATSAASTLAGVLALFVLIALAQSSMNGQEATTTATTTATCCRVRVDEFHVAPGGESVRIVINWIRSDNSIQDSRAFAVTDGDAATTTDDYLWGTGIAPQPAGIMRKVTSAATDETGGIKQRFSRAVLRWMQTTGRIGATEISIP